MTFPHRKTPIFNTPAFVTILDLFFATMILGSTIMSMVGITKSLWLGCMYVGHHWWIIFQLPVYWLAIVVWLVLVILACVLVALSCTMYGQAWVTFKNHFAPEDEVC